MEAILNDRYQLQDIIGRGGMGMVCKGFDTTLKRNIAVKILTETNLGTEARARLLHEAQATARLNHPNIVTVYDIGETDLSIFGNYESLIPYIVMEYIEGDTLYEHPLEDIEEVVAFAKQLCAALEHAHSNGIIHRDLKPENIIIIPDGTAKLMDFGLARSVASRLTDEGKLIGTVFYMAPEQALGQGIDHRADLYALGVLLYELLTGQLPFQADDPVAVISQHIHAPVVPPRAKNEQIPAFLNDLIVGLLSKDPNDRPVSAEAVLNRLTEQEPSGAAAYPTAELSVLDRIVRGHLVGREFEVAESRRIWKQARSGEGQLLLISGEPGVGKTRLVHEIVTQAEVSGGQAYIGESQAEGNAPYAAFAQLIRRALHAKQNDGLEIPKLVMAELIAIVPELLLDYPEISPNPPLEPDSERRRLFESVFRFISNLSEKKPILLVLEDIHWADSGTLALLHFLAQRTLQLPVMLLGTYRDVELDQTLPFHETLLDLDRRNLGRRLKLRRLDQIKTQELLTVIFAEEVTPEFLDGIYNKTEGNPFFVEEVCKALVESGELYFVDGEWHRPDMADLSIPQSIKVAVQSRINKLSKNSQETLLNAAMIGREFDFGILMRVMDQDEDILINVMEAALKSHLIEERNQLSAECFWFSHALIPAVLRESISGLRRARLYRKVASVVEEIHPEAYQRLAFYWGEAGDEERGLIFIIKAADQARQAYANEDAIRLYSEALVLLPEDHQDRFDLLAARSAVYDMVADRAAQLSDVKVLLTLAEKLGDQTWLVDALIALSQLNIEIDVPQAREPAERALELSKQMDDPVREGRAYYLLGMHAHLLDEIHKAYQYIENAIELARAAGATRDMVEYLSAFSIMSSRIGDRNNAHNAAQEALTLSKEINDKRLEMTVNVRMAGIYRSPDNNRDALQTIEAALRTAREFGDMDRELNALNIAALILMRLNQYENAETYFLEIFQTKGLFSSTAAGYAIRNFKHLYMHMMAYEKLLFLMADLVDRANQAQKAYWIYLTKSEYALALFFAGRYRDGLEIGESNWPYIERTFNQREQAVQLGFLGFFAAACGNFELVYSYLEKAQRRIKNLDESNITANVLLLSAHAALFDGKPGAVNIGLEQAFRGIEIYGKNQNIPRWRNYYILAGLHLALADEDQTNVVKSLDLVEQALRIYDEYPSSWLPPEYLFSLASRIYRANDHQREADELLRRAFERIMLVAENIKDDDLRQNFLENVIVNREILKEAKENGIAIYRAPE